jgi:hypothetical protein
MKKQSGRTLILKDRELRLFGYDIETSITEKM